MKKTLVVIRDSDEIREKKHMAVIQKLSDIGSECSALLLESNDGKEDIAQLLAEQGSQTQYFFCHQAGIFDPEIYGEMIDQVEADAVFLPADEEMNVYGARLAALRGVPFFKDIHRCNIENETPIAERMAFAGKAIEKIRIRTSRFVMSFKPGAFSEPEKFSEGKFNPQNSVFETDIRQMQAEEVVNSSKDEIDLTAAKVVVGVGRGAKDEAGIGFVKEFAASIQAGFGGSRSVVDSGFLPPQKQIGQTGKTISPELYICAGVSGAVQHIAGVNRSKTILAVNIDPEAPIFKSADYGIVGDLFEVLPLLKGRIKELGFE